MGERKFRDVLLKIWSIFLASAGVTLHIEFVCGLRECPPGSFLRQNVSIAMLMDKDFEIPSVREFRPCVCMLYAPKCWDLGMCKHFFSGWYSGV